MEELAEVEEVERTMEAPVEAVDSLVFGMVVRSWAESVTSGEPRYRTHSEPALLHLPEPGS